MRSRDPFKPRPVTSRRGGPVKQPLSRESIVTAALDLLTREGLEGMSLRKVAAALDTGAASLYVYVADLQELRALVLDRAMGQLKRPAASGDWRSRLIALLEAYLHLLLDRPGLAQLAMSALPVGPNSLSLTEDILALLQEGGKSPATAAWAVDLLLLYVTSTAAEQSQWGGHADPLAGLAQSLGSASAEQYPHIHAARNHLLSGTGPDRFAWAIGVLLEGIANAPSPDNRLPPHS